MYPLAGSGADDLRMNYVATMPKGEQTDDPVKYRPIGQNVVFLSTVHRRRAVGLA